MEVILYSNGCPKCEVLKQKLRAKNISYTTSEDFDFLESLKIDTLPVLIVDKILYPNFMDAINWVNSQEE